MGKETKYTSITGSLITIYKEDGIKGYFRGNFANIIRVIPVYALKFAFNDWFRDIVRKKGQADKDLSFKQLISSGVLAGLFQQTVTFPLEFIRTRLSVVHGFGDTQHYNGILDCTRQTIKKEGPFALYKGFTATLISGAPYVGLQMTFYELFKRILPGGRDSLPQQLVSGALAGFLAQSITFPGDTVRRRMMTNGMGGRPNHYKGTIDCTIQIWKKEGWKAFFYGIKTNVVRCIPEAAIQFVVYEKCKKFFEV